MYARAQSAFRAFFDRLGVLLQDRNEVMEHIQFQEMRIGFGLLQPPLEESVAVPEQPRLPQHSNKRVRPERNLLRRYRPFVDYLLYDAR